MWAREGGCAANPGYMLTSCCLSCSASANTDPPIRYPRYPPIRYPLLTPTLPDIPGCYWIAPTSCERIPVPMNEWRYIQNSTRSGHIDYELCREKFSHIENICGADRVQIMYVPFEDSQAPLAQSSFLRTCENPKEPPNDSRLQVKIVCIQDKYKHEEQGQSSIKINWTVRKPWPVTPQRRAADIPNKINLVILITPKEVSAKLVPLGKAGVTLVRPEREPVNKDYYEGQVQIFLNNTNKDNAFKSGTNRDVSADWPPGSYLINASLTGKFENNQQYESKDQVTIDILP